MVSPSASRSRFTITIRSDGETCRQRPRYAPAVVTVSDSVLLPGRIPRCTMSSLNDVIVSSCAIFGSRTKVPLPRRRTMRPGQPVTEDHVAGRADLDLRSTLELVELINDEDAGVPVAVRSAAHPLAVAIDAIAERVARGGRLIYVGAGSSGRLAAVDAAECGPTFGVPPDQVVVIVAGGVAALAVAQEAAEDDGAAGARDLQAAGVQQRDSVVLLSARGGNPYVNRAAHAPRRAGALTVALVYAHHSELGRPV